MEIQSWSGRRGEVSQKMWAVSDASKEAPTLRHLVAKGMRR
jgi:hypothetical protein